MAAMIKEVAKRAGVSTATVSRILNGKGNHSSSTVKTIEKIAEELGFSASHIFSAPECIGVVMLSYQNFLNNPYTTAMLAGITETLAGEGLLAQIIPVSPGRLSCQFLKELVSAYNLKGLIIQEFDQLYHLSDQLALLNLPVVCIGVSTVQNGQCHVTSDDYQAGHDAAAYFWSLGHRRFGILPMRLTNIGQKKRLDGFKSCIATNGGNPESVWIKEFYHIDDSVTAAVAEFLNMKQRPTAILCTNSTIAAKFMIALKQAGIAIPEELSLISFEENGELEMLETPITAICQPTYKMGEEAVRMIIGLIRGQQIAEKQVLRCNLIVRNTTAIIQTAK